MKSKFLKLAVLIGIVGTVASAFCSAETKLRQEVDIQENYITNLATPTQLDHAVPKDYVNYVLDISQNKLPKPGNGVGVCAGETGTPWPNPRFTDNGDDTVTDKLTGLMWTKSGNIRGSSCDWTNAIDYCENLVANGYSDWRLPNVDELKSLVNYSQANSATWLNSSATPFGAVQAYRYWSASTYASNSDYAWVVYMSNGSVSYSGKTRSRFVWPVRSGR